MKNPDMKVRVSPELRSLIEAASKVNERTLNAEIAARLQWSFDKGYDAGAEVEAVREGALARIQASPIIRLEKQLIRDKAELERQIDDLAEEVEAIKKQLMALVDR
jgi:hypothetical protein